MKNSSNYEAIGSGSTALQIVFVVLKLCKVINWSWWWVLSPTWISVILVLVIWAIAVFIAIKK